MAKAKIYILNHGIIGVDKALQLAGADIATESNRNRPRVWYEAPTYTVYVDHPEGKLILDTSCPPDWRDRWPARSCELAPYYGTPDQFFSARLEMLGLKPADFRFLVLSHLHMDHCGNVNLFSKTGTTVVVHRDELRHGYVPDPWESFPYVRSQFDVPAINWLTITKDTEIMKDVWLIHTPGHSAGLLSVMVHLADYGTMIFTGDAAHMRENYGPPVAFPGTVYDSLSYVTSIEKLRELEKKYQATVYFGHDSDQARTEYRFAPEYYS